jgi:phosphatidylglycerophosphate synthase
MAQYSLRDAFRPPGLISLVRLPLGIAFLFVMDNSAAAIGILVAAAFSDALDGWVARHFRQATATGAALDAVMDKAFVLVVVFALVLRGPLTLVEAILLGTRDLGELPLVLRAAARHRIGVGAPRRANVLGKVATVLQFATLAAILVGAPHRGVWVAVTSLSGAVAAVGYWLRERHTEAAPESPRERAP